MFSNPKRWADRPATAKSFYEYYAGFSSAFARDAIEKLDLPSGSVLLDPWNGAGTTTEAGVAAGIRVVGYDINPVMVLVAKARLLNRTVSASIPSITKDILRKTEKVIPGQLDFEDPLTLWFTPAASVDVRSIDLAIQKLLTPFSIHQRIARLETLDDVSSLAAFYYTALFRCVRKLVKRFTVSNPTWIKTTGRRVSANRLSLHAAFTTEVDVLRKALDERVLTTNGIDATLDVASSLALPLGEATVDAVVASPPYCTRLDYAIATSPELAVIGASSSDVGWLRNEMIGSPTVGDAELDPAKSWGRNCNRFLEAVKIHPSRASSGYYTKVFLNYFAKMDRSLAEVRRVLSEDGRALLVVQDSYYKDVHNDLAVTLTEMASCHGLILAHRDDFTIYNSLRSINTRSRAYRDGCSVVESALLLARSN